MPPPAGALGREAEVTSSAASTAVASRLVPCLREPIDERRVRLVEDADEEIFLLYSLGAAETGRRGLGYVQGSTDLLRVEIELQHSSTTAAAASQDDIICPGVTVQNVDDHQDALAPRAKSGKAVHRAPSQVTAYVWQSQTGLRSSRGDTGSVVWRSTIRLATLLLRQACKKANVDANGDIVPSLIDLSSSAPLRIIELGAGTGALSSLAFPHLSTLAPGLTWTATDQDAMLPLLRKNLQHTRRVAGLSEHALAEAPLDWLDVQAAARSRQSSALPRALQHLHPCSDSVDLLLAVDCIFNPYLIPAFLDTLASLCTADHTVALVLVELREQEMMTEFLQAWIDHTLPSQPAVRWTVHSLSDAVLGNVGLEKGYGCFVGTRHGS